MDDTIYRQAAINALADYIHNVDKVMGTGHLTADDCKDAATSVLEVLPSAQSEQCSDCIANGGDWECDHMHCRKGRLPSAQPERKKGKWINVNDGKWNTFEVLKCSVCGELDNRMDWTDNYCPNCGADMRGEKDE